MTAGMVVHWTSEKEATEAMNDARVVMEAVNNARAGTGVHWVHRRSCSS